MPLTIVLALLSPTLAIGQTSLQPRMGHRMIYSQEKDTVVLFGGMVLTTSTYYNDLWTYNPSQNTWTEHTTENPPSPRGTPGFAYNPDTEEALLFGGLSQSARYSDTWLLNIDTKTWTKLTPEDSPPARSDMGLVYDRVNKIYVLYGGYGNTGGLLDDTWLFSAEDNTWTKLETENIPSRMYGQSMWWNPVTERIEIYAGHTGSPVSSTYLEEIWTLDFNSKNWETITTQSNPSGRYWTTADINENGKLVCFGGTGGTPLGETLILDSSEWSSSTPQPTPSPRFFSQIVYIWDNEFILFGGGIGTEAYGDTWRYKLDSGWELLDPNYSKTESNDGIKIPVTPWMYIIGLFLSSILLKRFKRL